jgi:hypothetical protein
LIYKDKKLKKKCLKIYKNNKNNKKREIFEKLKIEQLLIEFYSKI